MKLHDVTITKNDTCLTYALKRLGLNPDLCTYSNIHEHFQQKPFNPSKLQVGDILLWDKDIKWEWMPITIQNKTITWANIPRGFHFAIYEGDNLFSDCTRLVTPPHPTLRLRTISDLKKYPDWIMVLNQ